MINKEHFQKFLPLIGPIALFLLWELILSAKWVKPILLPPPGATLAFMGESFLNGSIYFDLYATIKRTFYAFAIATAINFCASPSETPFSRLNESVAAANNP